MKYINVKVVYFSGTGGTERVADLTYELLVEHGVTVRKEPLEHINHSKKAICDTRDIDLIIVLYPVYAFGAPEPIYKWIKRLTKAGTTPVAVISISGGGEIWSNSACRAGIIKKLDKKGFKTIYERMLVLPSNFLVATHKSIAIQLLKILPSRIEKMVQEILEGKTRRTKPNIGGRILTAIGRIEQPCARMFAKGLRVRETCNGCGWCAKNCPMDNIEMRANKPVFKWNCVTCLRCIYGCPQNAIYTKLYTFMIIKEGYKFDELLKQANDSELEPIDNMQVGFLLKGAKEYIEE